VNTNLNFLSHDDNLVHLLNSASKFIHKNLKLDKFTS